jgi:phosphoribosylaminoimidazole carboxylase (NCAIR synthetase)
MSFFSSEVVRAEMTEIGEMQEEVYKNVFKFPTMSREEKLDHVKLLEKLLDKQNAKLHIYGKNGIKPKRKMGHINFIYDEIFS